jgi:cyclopropane fatty-acyl-phospholipid synthase-like methyltransferase
VGVETLDLADFYDAELKLHNAHLRAAASVGIGDRVLDIGCGAGQSDA